MPPEGGLGEYKRLVERYHETLDLVSPKALAGFDALLEEASRYGRLIAGLSPAVDSVLDLGSGVGLPGIPVAFSVPDARVLLVERRRKRATFLRIAVSQLGLENAVVVGGDVRELEGVVAEVITAQAVAELEEVYRLTRHLHAERVWLVSRKGADWRQELRTLEVEIGSAAIEVREEPLSGRGTLVAVLLPGGSACPPSV